MSSIVSPRARVGPWRPALRVVGSDRAAAPRGERAEGVELYGPSSRTVLDDGRGHVRSLAPVLLVGADERGRADLRADLGATLPPRTRWVEADDVAGVLQRAAYCRMVVLAGDLHDADADSLMRLLGRRHPELPVICVQGSLPALAGGRG